MYIFASPSTMCYFLFCWQPKNTTLMNMQTELFCVAEGVGEGLLPAVDIGADEFGGVVGGGG